MTKRVKILITFSTVLFLFLGSMLNVYAQSYQSWEKSFEINEYKVKCLIGIQKQPKRIEEVKEIGNTIQLYSFYTIQKIALAITLWNHTLNYWHVCCTKFHMV